MLLIFIDLEKKELLKERFSCVFNEFIICKVRHPCHWGSQNQEFRWLPCRPWIPSCCRRCRSCRSGSRIHGQMLKTVRKCLEHLLTLCFLISCVYVRPRSVRLADKCGNLHICTYNTKSKTFYLSVGCLRRSGINIGDISAANLGGGTPDQLGVVASDSLGACLGK